MKLDMLSAFVSMDGRLFFALDRRCRKPHSRPRVHRYNFETVRNMLCMHLHAFTMYGDGRLQVTPGMRSLSLLRCGHSPSDQPLKGHITAKLQWSDHSWQPIGQLARNVTKLCALLLKFSNTCLVAVSTCHIFARPRTFFS